MIVGLLLAAALVVLFCWNRSRSVQAQKGRVTNVLKKYSVLRSYKVLSDITLANGKETVHVDNILVGFFGLLFVNAQVEKADYYGDEKDEYWSYVKKDVKTRFKNPLNEGKTAMETVRRNLAKHDIYKIQMDEVVVFTTSFRKTGLYIKNTLPVVNVRKFSAFLNKNRFEKDNNVDVEQLLQLIDECRA